MEKNTYPGKFIVFEGLDGSGQSTQAGSLLDFLNKYTGKLKLGFPGVFLTKEPTPGLIGGLIRGQLTHDWKSSAECLQLLFCADRAHHLKKEIEPLLRKGSSVICDRYFFSTVAFGSLEVNRDWLLSLNENFLLPDLTFLLKVSPRVCVERMRGSRYELELFEKEELLQKVWTNYERLSREFENVCVVNGERSIEEISKEITETLTRKFNWQ